MSTPIPALGNKTPEQLKVTELREELKKRGLNFKGLKKDLVERLDEVLRVELAAQESEASPEDDRQSSDEEEVATPPPEQFEEPPKAVVPVPVVEEEKVVVEPDPVKSAPEVPPLPISKSVEEDLVVNHLDGDGTIKLDVDLVADPEVTRQESVAEPEASVVLHETIESPEAAEVEEDPRSHQSLESQFEEGKVLENDTVAAEVVDEHMAESSVLSKEVADENPPIASEGRGEGQLDLEKPPEIDFEVKTGDVDEIKPVPKPYPSATQAASTEAIILETSDGEVEPEALPHEKAPTSEVLDGEVDGMRVDEVGSLTEATGEVMMETTVTETVVTVTTETTVVDTEEVIYSEMEAEVSRAAGDHDVGSPMERNSDAGTRSVEPKDRTDANKDEQRDEEGMESEDNGITKESKPMDIDSENITGSKRKEGDDARQQEPAKRQRRWNSDKSTGEIKSPSKVPTDSAKEIALAEVREGTVATSAAGSPSTVVNPPLRTAASSNFEKAATSRPHLGKLDASVNGETDKKRHVPPPIRSATTSLKIDRFVRPFTIKAVKELLEQTGTVNDMWMDQIKTHCYVTYSAVEEAIATRNALYNLQWPVAGGKLLVAEFVEPEEVKLRVDGLADKPAATPVTTPRGSANNAVPAGAPMGLMALSTPTPTSALPPPPPLPPPPRERPVMPTKKDLEPPIPTLDDLFKKTRTKPQIYYLPLTAEQVAANVRNKPPGSKPAVKV